MMRRHEFTYKINQLLWMMICAGERPVLDFGLRSTGEQNRLYRRGKSLCDGYIRKSRHQRGLAEDIYLTGENGRTQYAWDREKAIFWHEQALGLGLRPMVWWTRGGKTVYDYCHFEG